MAAPGGVVAVHQNMPDAHFIFMAIRGLFYGKFV
jgi:hypothetical protein